VQEAQRIRAAVSPVGDHGFLITATRGSLAAATEGFRATPSPTGPGPSSASSSKWASDWAAPPRTPRRTRGPRSAARPTRRAAIRARWTWRAAPWSRPSVSLPRPLSGPGASKRWPGWRTSCPRAETALAVDAETASRLLSVTPRTARRLLHTLVADGLAWPLAPGRTPQPGRPRQFYRLLVEKLGQDSHTGGSHPRPG